MPTIAIINTSEETVNMLLGLLDDDGFSTVAAYTIDFKRGIQDLERFFGYHRPDAVLCDVSLPFEENWTFCRERVVQASGLTAHHFVFTTTNKAVLEGLVGPTSAIEFVGKPHDLHEVLSAVHHAAAGEQRGPFETG